MGPFALPLKRILSRSLRLSLAVFLGLAFRPPLGAEIKVPFWVKDGSGAYLPDAPADRFRVWLEGQPVPVQSVQTPKENLILLVVMDAVGDLSRIDAARNALVQALERMGSREYVAILQAQDGLQVIQEPTADRDALREAIFNLKVSGIPGLLESLENAVSIGDSMLRSSEVRVAVLYVTDGSIYDYRGDYTNPVINPSDNSDLSRRFRDRLIQERISRTLRVVAGSWTPLFFLHLENRNDSLNVVYQNGLTQFAQATGGEALFCNSIAQIPAFLHQLVDRITNMHMIAIETPDRFEGRARIHMEAAPGLALAHREQIEISPRKSKAKGGEKE